MKKATLFYLLLILSTTSMMAQNAQGKRKQKQKSTVATMDQSSGVKLDDLKNPFDTTKVKGGGPQQRQGLQKGKGKKGGGNGNNSLASSSSSSSDIKSVANSSNVPDVPMKRSQVTLRPDLKVITKTFKSKNGNVDIRFEKNKSPKDNIKTKPKSTNKAMCFSKEEVRGQKIENEIIIADGSKATRILPGAVIDASALLNTGEFVFVNGKNRKRISLTASTNQANKKKEIVEPRPNVSIESDLRAKTQELTSPKNINNMPNMSSSSEVGIATLNETIGLKTGSSFFYLGIKANDAFSFSSEKYHYMYIYTFEQICYSVFTDEITSPDDLFTVPTPLDNNLLYINEVKYGRRVNVLVESTYDLMSTSYAAGGQVSLKAVSASLEGEASYSKETSQINIRAYTQGGSPLAITNIGQVEKEVEKYFNQNFKDIDMVPLAYKMCYMDGVRVSQVTDAFLDGENCLDAEKVKVRIMSIKCKKVDDSKNNEELYGNASIKMYNSQGQLVNAIGLPSPPIVPTASLSFGSKDVPINLQAGREKMYDINEQGKYVVLMISDLDTKFEILPYVYEKDNGFNSDDQYTTENIFKKTLRQMLLEGVTSQEFEFRRKGSVMVVTFEITPL